MEYSLVLQDCVRRCDVPNQLTSRPELNPPAVQHDCRDKFVFDFHPAIEPPPQGLTLVHIVRTKYTDCFTDGTTVTAFPGDPAIDSHFNEANAPIPTHEGLTWVHTVGQNLYDTPSGDLEVGDYAVQPDNSYIENAPPFVSSTSTPIQIATSTTSSAATDASSSLSNDASSAVPDSSTSTTPFASGNSAGTTTSSEPTTSTSSTTSL